MLNLFSKLLLFTFTVSFLSLLAVTKPAITIAQTTTIPLTVVESTESASTASESTSLASPSAEVEKKIQDVKDEDITDTSGKQKSKLAKYLDDNPLSPIAWHNPLQHAIRNAVSEGVQANIIVLVILFPLIATLIAASRHIIGLRGFGIYIPAVLSVALVSTGVFEGMIIFIAIVTTATLMKGLIKRAKLPYLPRTALVLWTVSLGILGVLFIAPTLNLVTLMSVNIFPILILVLLAENFLDAQARTKQSEAIALTIETIGLSFISGLLLKWEALQQFALLEPELLLLLTAILAVGTGKFVGLRISERLRFRSLIEEEAE